jgi:hypothetical protein
MDPNTHSTHPPSGQLDDDLAALEAAAGRLAAQDLDRLPDAAVADQVLALRRLLDGLEGHWLKELAGVDGRGAAGADQDQQVGSTAAWLRGRLRLGDGAARRCWPPWSRWLALGCRRCPQRQPTHRRRPDRARPAQPRGRLPTTGGVRPQLAVVVDLASLLGQPRGLVGN